MKTGVVLLNFGEPEAATLEEVVPFLERIFIQNASLMGSASPEQVRERSRQLAEDRAPGLILEYEEIGGSPLHRQSRGQAEALGAELERRGMEVVVTLGMQFTQPSVAEAVAELRASGVDQLIGLPVYPLAGPSTSLAALAAVDAAVAQLGWAVRHRQINGWHRHPLYLELRTAAIRRVLDTNGLSLRDPRTRLVFSAHGTPIQYIEAGSRYEEYVREFCASVAGELGNVEYTIGYQNHANRPNVRWTQPDVEQVVSELEANRLVVDAVSFMHEQSETLAELDHELREVAEARGIDFHRVPIPHDSTEFTRVLADLIEAVALSESMTSGANAVAIAGVPLERCACKNTPYTYCTNRGPRSI